MSTTTRDESAGETAQPQGPDRDAALGGQISRLFQWSLTLGLVIVLVGTGVALVQDQDIPTATMGLTSIPAGLIRLQGDAVLTLGLLIVLATPAMGLAYLAQIFVRQNDRRYTVVAVVVLAIILGSIAINKGTN